MWQSHPTCCQILVCTVKNVNKKAANDSRPRKIKNGWMDIKGKARQAELWSRAKDGAGKERRRRRGWNTQRRCGDLLREKQMLCFTHIYCTERERESEGERERERGSKKIGERANPLSPPSALPRQLLHHLPPCIHCHQSRAEGAWWLAHDSAGRRFRLEGKPRCAHARGSGHLCADSTTCSASSDCQVAKLRSLRSHPSASLLLPVLLSSFFLSLRVASCCRTCICLFSWPSEPGRIGRCIYPPPLPRLHVTSAEEVWVSWILLVEQVVRIRRRGSARGWSVWLLHDEMSEPQCFLRGSLMCCGIHRVEASPLGLPKGLYQFSPLHFSYQAAAGPAFPDISTKLQNFRTAYLTLCC